MGDEDFSLAAELGASEGIAAQRFTIYLPNKNRRGVITQNIEDYISAGMDLMAEINGGVTRMPGGQGIWLDETSGEGTEPTTVREDTVLIYSYLTHPRKFVERIEDIRGFLHTFGRETEQGEVKVEFFGQKDEGGSYLRVYSIRSFDT